MSTTEVPSSGKISPIPKVKRYVRTHLDRARNYIYSRPGPLPRFLRHPNPWRAPYRASTVDILRGKGIGDVLMCTPALRELKRLNPACRVRFFTNFGQLLHGLPYIDEVHPTKLAPVGSLNLSYENGIPPRAHLARIMGDQLGVNVMDIRPGCMVKEELVAAYQAAWQTLPKPHIVILRRANPWTPNKDWPEQYWNVLAENVSHLGTVIEIGGLGLEVPRPTGAYLDLRGTTTIEQLIAAVAAADLYIGPVSGPMHIAAAVNTPAVVIYGGYEHPIGLEGYETLPGAEQISLYSAVPCAPCWLNVECPYNRKCLSMIEPSQVLAAVQQALSKHFALPQALAYPKAQGA